MKIFREPCDRNVKDVELICARLRRVDQLCRLPNSVLQQLALCGYYEDLENEVTHAERRYHAVSQNLDDQKYCETKSVL
ncbi:hypothetical protein HUJ05_008013 [Dendroctonus ponderosae]|nr:hypothetical protein HUJ05_008013 [Dendroctonus ponderosae]